MSMQTSYCRLRSLTCARKTGSRCPDTPAVAMVALYVHGRRGCVCCEPLVLLCLSEPAPWPRTCAVDGESLGWFDPKMAFSCSPLRSSVVTGGAVGCAVGAFKPKLNKMGLIGVFHESTCTKWLRNSLNWVYLTKRPNCDTSITSTQHGHSGQDVKDTHTERDRGQGDKAGWLLSVAWPCQTQHVEGTANEQQ